MIVKRMLFVCLLAAGCKQGIGQRCQVTADCETPLICNKAKNTCESTAGGEADAEVPDGPPADAAVDAMIDAMGSGSAVLPSSY